MSFYQAGLLENNKLNE